MLRIFFSLNYEHSLLHHLHRRQINQHAEEEEEKSLLTYLNIYHIARSTQQTIHYNKGQLNLGKVCLRSFAIIYHNSVVSLMIYPNKK
jgi:hypothetical protein